MDAKSEKLNKQEEKRQKETISLIPSENYASENVREALASVLMNKYSEGYPHKRYYPGNRYIDEVELLAQKRALELFDLNDKKWAVNVQPYSGSPANFAVYSALLDKNSTALGMSLPEGGHLTHGHSASLTGKFFNFKQYGLTKEGRLDYKEIESLTEKHKPKLIVAGATAYSREINWKKLAQIAKKYNSFLMADISHIAGLVAAGAHSSPFGYCDIVTTTTHKTLRGPRGALVFSRKSEILNSKFETNSKSQIKNSKLTLNQAIDKAVFPGLQGGPHNNQTLAIAVALKEARTNKFKKYGKQIVKNAKALSQELQNLGYKIVSDGTDNHLFLLDLSPTGRTGGEAEKLLEKNGITANRNTVPNDPRSPFDPSGLRVGTPAVTTRGMKEKEMKIIAQLIHLALSGKDVSREVKKNALRFPPQGY